MGKDKFNKKVKNLMSEINYAVGKKEGDLSATLEKNLVLNLKESDKKEYYEIKSVFNKLKEEIKSKVGDKTIAEKIKDVKISGQDRFLTEYEERIKKNINLYMERQLLILSILRQVSEKKVKLKEIESSFDKYVLSNFYRTFCEISLRLFTDVCLLILNYTKTNTAYTNSKKLNEIHKLILKVKDNNITLGDLRNILDKFDNLLTNKIGLKTIIEKIFLYEKGKGFSLRNSIAHETKFLNEFENDYLIEQLQRVNRLDLAFIIVFYFDTLGKMFSKKDLDLTNKIFSS